MLPVVPIIAAVGVGGLAWYFLKPKPPETPQLPPPVTKQSPTFTSSDLAKAGIPVKPDVAVDIGPATIELEPGEAEAAYAASSAAISALTGSALGAMGIVNTQKDPLALRSAASTSSTVLKWMAKGSPLSILNEVSPDGKWVKVVSAGAPGWAYKEYVKAV